MRKGIVWLLVVLVAVFGSLYFFIPRNIAIKKQIDVTVNSNAFMRSLFDESTWPLWWPSGDTKNEPGLADNGLVYKGNVYSIREKKISSLVISIKGKTDSVLTELIAIPLRTDSLQLAWVGIARAGVNPVKRFQNWQWTHGISKDMETLLQKLRAYFSSEDHLYSIHIDKELVRDSTLISTAATSKDYPTTDFVYNMVDKLNRFATANNAVQTGLPMLNITPLQNGTYTTKVALPVDKKLKDKGDIQYRWMLGGGNILVAKVTGGPRQIERAFEEMERYVEENQRIAPAIPFQSLVTDRRTVPDTSKWVTKIYWPVM